MFETTLNIDGMACGMCESHVQDVVRQNFSVKKVTASHSKGTCVILSKTVPDETKLRQVIDATGYTVTGFACHPVEEKKGFFARFRK